MSDTTVTPIVSPEELRALIYSLDYAERAAILVLSIIERNKHNPIIPVLDMIKVTNAMTRYLNQNDRVVVANAFRDAADICEHRNG